MFLTAQEIVRAGGAWGFGQIAVAIIIVLAVIAVVYVITRAMGVTIPAWLLQVIGIVIMAAVGILAIRFLLSL
jgi:hypothetical protein